MTEKNKIVTYENGGISRFVLQIIAMVTMFIDHFSKMYFSNSPAITLLVNIGRIAFITYALLLAEGFWHIRNDSKKRVDHALFLIVMMIISEIPFDLVTRHVTVNWTYQNVIVTLLIGYIILLIYNRLYYKVLILPVLVITYYVCYILNSDCGFYGVILIFTFYLYFNAIQVCHDTWPVRLLTLAVLVGLFVYFSGFPIRFICGYIAAVIILSFYKGKRGVNNYIFNSLYKVFYPLHMFVIGLRFLI